jgi:hypothetical protein
MIVRLIHHIKISPDYKPYEFPSGQLSNSLCLSISSLFILHIIPFLFIFPESSSVSSGNTDENEYYCLAEVCHLPRHSFQEDFGIVLLVRQVRGRGKVQQAALEEDEVL